MRRSSDSLHEHTMIDQTMSKQGAEFVSEPIAWPADRGGWSFCFLYDPDGNRHLTVSRCSPE